MLAEIFLAFLKLGLSSFGGPVAHVGYFRQEFVIRRKWLDDRAYTDLVSLGQFLPGPASSQVGIGLGLLRGGIPGALAAWLGFTLPSAVALIAFGLLLSRITGTTQLHWLHGLKVAAVAVVALAIWGMGKNLCRGRERATLAVAAATVAALLPGAWTQIGVILASALIGSMWLKSQDSLPPQPFPVALSKTAGWIALGLFVVLLFVLPPLAEHSSSYPFQLFDSFFRAGALVFGGGHVVLPVLQAEVVPKGWLSNDTFLAGYGAAQAVPGPLFTFAAYLGAVSSGAPNGWLGGLLATVAIFLPGFLLVIGVLPLWEGARHHPAMQRAVKGINAAVVGLLLAAFYNPVWVSAIHAPADFALACTAFLLLHSRNVPPWLVVALCAATTGLTAS